MNEDEAIKRLEYALWKLEERKKYGDVDLSAERGRVVVALVRLTNIMVEAQGAA